MTTDFDFDRLDALEDQALTRLRDADARSDEETDEEEAPPRGPSPQPVARRGRTGVHHTSASSALAASATIVL